MVYVWSANFLDPEKVCTCAQEVASLNLELETAREAAARMKLEDGAPTFGAIEITPFTLPNPGGGLDLLEEAQAVLVPGRRCDDAYTHLS